MALGVKKRLSGIILAAGFSSRMGRWKMELSIKGRPLIYHTLMPMFEVCESIVIVGGYSIQRLSEIIEDICYNNEIERGKIRIAKNDNFQNGMFSSVKKGLMEIDESSDGIFIMPGDMPFVKPDTYRKLAFFLEKETNKDVIFPTTLNSIEEEGLPWKKGHPVLLRNRIRELILKNDDNNIFRDVLKPFNYELCPVDDEGICLDIDDEIDFEKALQSMEKKIKQP